MPPELDLSDPYDYARWQVASMPAPTPWLELEGKPPKEIAIALITQREIPGLQDNYFHQTLIVDTLQQASPQGVVCIEEGGIASLRARVPETDLLLGAVVDLSTLPERRPILYSLNEEGQPGLELSILGFLLSVETSEVQGDLGVRKALGLRMVLNSPPPHRISILSCRMLPSKPLPQTLLESVRDLEGGSVDKLETGGQKYTLRDGYSEEGLEALTLIPTFRSIDFLDQLASVVFDAYSHAEIVPVSEELSR